MKPRPSTLPSALLAAALLVATPFDAQVGRAQTSVNGIALVLSGRAVRHDTGTVRVVGFRQHEGRSGDSFPGPLPVRCGGEAPDPSSRILHRRHRFRGPIPTRSPLPCGRRLGEKAA